MDNPFADTVSMRIRRTLRAAGESLSATLGQSWDIARFAGTMLFAAVGSWRNRSFLSQISAQVFFTGVEALGLVSIIGLIAGMTIVIQATVNMPRFGVGQYIGNLLVI